MKWEAFKDKVESMRDRATTFENAYNGIKGSIKRQEGVCQVLEAFPQAARTQVDKQRERVEEAKRIALSEKRKYVSVSCLLPNFNVS